MDDKQKRVISNKLKVELAAKNKEWSRALSERTRRIINDLKSRNN